MSVLEADRPYEKLNDEKPVDRLVNKFSLLFILLDNLYVPINLGFDFRVQYILYTLFILYYFLKYKKVIANKNIVIYLIALILFLTLIPIVSGAGLVAFFRQFALIVFSLLFSFLLLNAYRFNVEKIFKDYTDWVYLSAVIGAIQIVSQIIGFRYGADFSFLGFEMQNFSMNIYAIQSWYQEPSFLAIAFAPVLFACIARLFGLTDIISLSKAIFIILILILSKSSSGFLTLLLCFLIVVVNKYSILRKPHIVVILLIFFAMVSFSFYSMPQFKLRVDDTAKLFFSKRVTAQDIDKTNLSTYVFYSNYMVTKATFWDNPLFGTGLGTHELNYNEYINQVIPESKLKDEFPVNKDANSLLFRIISETGLAGLLLFFFYVSKNRVKLHLRSQTQAQINLWVINSGVLVLIFIRLLRQGHYTMLGFMFFILLYIYSKQKAIQRSREFRTNQIS